MKKLGKAISKRIKALREASGLSQQEVAVRADLSLSLVAKLEQGKKADPRASTLLALAVALGVPPGQLLDDLAEPVEEAHVNGELTAPPEVTVDVTTNGVEKPAKKDGKKKKKKAKRKEA
jgi:transcriptional regulator with XRE-family HTH domain